MPKKTPEHERLNSHHHREANWKFWGPYVSERAWATVREDYSYDGEAWDYFPHEHARSRAYRWNEDGIAGISDRFQYLCFAPTFWNEKDAILKERFYGLNPKEGNHGEDGKEYYFYLDNTPTHSYMKMLYKYPQSAYPYETLVIENQKRNSLTEEYELIDTGIFNQNRYFDIVIEYAKDDQNDILIQISATNRGPDTAPLYILPTLWFRNTWSWGYEKGPMGDMEGKPVLFETKDEKGSYIKVEHPVLQNYCLISEENLEWIFTENDSNLNKLYNQPNPSPYVKDAFHQYLIQNDKNAVNPQKRGTKTAAIIHRSIKSGETSSIRLRLSNNLPSKPFSDFNTVLKKRQNEADEFYATIQNPELDEDEKMVQRQAFAGLLWTKQLYYFDIEQWIEGDPAFPPVKRLLERNKNWIHLVNFDIISMPDKWEYPWYASWDLAFHCIPLVLIDPDFTKRQLTLMTREWYAHPNGQLPAYEWNFSDVNPPVLAWAAWRVYKIDAKQTGISDRPFLEGIYHKLLLNFTWWVNQKDAMGNNVFQGGFLGLDNISIFDRSMFPEKLGMIDQADGTAWMGFYCILMMKIALELAKEDPVYQDSATKFFEHFLRISSAMVSPERKGYSLWNDEDGFFYDALHTKGQVIPLRIRSLVGLLPLFAVETIEPTQLNALPVFKSRMEWFLSQRPNYTQTMACVDDPGVGSRSLMSILTKDRLISVLKYMLDPNEFLSEYGIRSLSKYHEDHTYSLDLEDQKYCIKYQPGESDFRNIAGGNSNWRGPIWLPINFLIIESLQKYYHYYGDELKVEFPTGSGNWLNLWDVSTQLSTRLMALFLKDKDGNRPIFPKDSPFNTNADWQNLMLFHEYFHGDTGKGLGASHQTGWTGLIAKLLQQSGAKN
ncbi:MAG: glucosidase [Parachlamydiaceae bacterium]|nr:glucosidase [Parachlamydiaceae bacterium]